MPETSQHQQRHDQPDRQAVEHPPGADRRQSPPDRLQRRALEPAQPGDHRIIDDRDRYRRTVQVTGEDPDRQRDQQHRGHQPPHTTGLQLMRQRGRFSGGPATPHPPGRPRGARSDSSGRRVRGHVHHPSDHQPRQRIASGRRIHRHRAGVVVATLPRARCSPLPHGVTSVPPEKGRRGHAALTKALFTLSGRLGGLASRPLGHWLGPAGRGHGPVPSLPGRVSTRRLLMGGEDRPIDDHSAT